MPQGTFPVATGAVSGDGRSQLITSLLGLKWNIERGIVAYPLRVVWNIYNPILLDDLTLRWDIDKMLSQSLTLLWDIERTVTLPGHCRFYKVSYEDRIYVLDKGKICQ